MLLCPGSHHVILNEYQPNGLKTLLLFADRAGRTAALTLDAGQIQGILERMDVSDIAALVGLPFVVRVEHRSGTAWLQAEVVACQVLKLPRRAQLALIA